MSKLASRKLWIAIAGIATGVATAFGADASQIQTVAGAVVSLISAVAYIIAEGKVDAAGVAKAITDTQAAVQVVTGNDAAVPADATAPTDTNAQEPAADPAQTTTSINVSAEVAAALKALGVVAA